MVQYMELPFSNICKIYKSVNISRKTVQMVSELGAVGSQSYRLHYEKIHNSRLFAIQKIVIAVTII